MPEFHNKKMIIYQNLIDAGCKKQDIKECILMYENKEEKKLANQLSLYRRALLNDLHQAQYKIDCLDYLLYQLEKTK
ncbi:hypothetical protein [Candidatus Stoquefichus sp. SB1]|uniref:hypothetical protein n=1 Tax=Candidatus Stoquefichus sp. SB1 TaxID=1658109 RepID=UPI00067EC575|nr:hypothetical protein [Candidatus Stoquefichus sp. SB1]